MPERVLQLDDLRNMDSPDKIAALFQKLGYNTAAQPLSIEELQLPGRIADHSSRLNQFLQRLLGRIMFLYFLQKKEFLAGSIQFLTNQYRRQLPAPDDTNYYAQVLEPLFFETLNHQRPNLESWWGRVPFLNGGLFVCVACA